MSKNRAGFFKIATILLAVSFFVQLLTAAGMVFFRSLALRLGVFSQMAEIHEYNGFIFTALVLAHIYLNWGWIRANILKR